MKYRILLSGGGTAGSVTPLIALAQEIQRRRQDVEFLFVGSNHGPEKMLADAAHIPFQSIDGGKLRRYFSWKNVTDIWKIWQGYRQAKKIINDWQPQIAVTAGSYVSVPIIKAAQRQGVKTVVHQQDVQPGLANTLMASRAEVITTAFEDSTRAFPKNKVQWIGNPVRPEIFEGNIDRAHKLFHLTSTLPILLVVGGATGSKKINAVFSSMAEKLSNEWQIIHVTGSDRDNITSNHPNYKTYSFLATEMADALTVADVVVSRAGLGAITELAALGKPTIFIPMPDTHQEKNAQVVAKANAGIVLDQRQDIQTTLLASLEKLRQYPELAQSLGHHLKEFYIPDALGRLTALVLNLLPS